MAGAFTAALPASLNAQATTTPPSSPSATMVWLDAGGARVQQPTSALRSAGSVGGGVWYGRTRVAFAAEGSVTLANDSVSAGQYVVRATMLPRPFLRTELDLSATTIGITMPGTTGSRAVAARQHLLAGPFEVSALAGAGQTERADARFRGHRLGGAIAWQRHTPAGTVRAGAQYVRSSTNDFRLMEASGIVLGQVAPAYTLADRQIEASWQRGPLWVQASRSWRNGTGVTIGKASAFHLAAAVNVSASTTLIAQVGEQLADVVRGVPQARYTGLAMRWNPLRPRTMRRDARALGDERGGTITMNEVPDVRGEEVFVQRRDGRGDLIVTIIAPANAVVEFATSATEWTPVTMTRTGNAFVHRVTLPSGSHRVAVRVNGGDWRAPRGLAAVADDFGGRAGLVVIP